MGRVRKGSVGKKLLRKIKDVFSEVYDPRAQSWIQIPTVDALLSGFAIFSMKFPSLLQFERAVRQKSSNSSSNLKSLYSVQEVPSDTQMRVILDEIDPDELRPAFKMFFSEVQRGNGLKKFEFLDKKYLLSIDGTGFFSSDEIHCASCLTKQKGGVEDRTVLYHHQMLAAVIVHPEMKTVIPVCPEPILRQDGVEKNDCERNACRRFLAKFREDHPRLEVIVIQDALSANVPHIKDLRDYGMSFILSVKPGSHSSLFNSMKIQAELEKLKHYEKVEFFGTKITKKRTHRFIYVNELLLNKVDLHNCVNFIDYVETTEWVNPEGEFKREVVHFSWVTNLEVKERNIFQLMRGARSRWHIENQTFNTLKNQGYHFEHNYGHGKKNLSTVFVLLMMLAFAFDQIQQLTCQLFRGALEASGSKIVLWKNFESFYRLTQLKSWDTLLKIIASPPNWKWVPDTS